MSANPNNAETGWNRPSAGVSAAGPVPTNVPVNVPVDELADAPVYEPAQDGGANALQALLAFACLHEQAARRRALKDSAASLQNPPALQTSSALASQNPPGSREREEE